jgi:hypothetical protein
MWPIMDLKVYFERFVGLFLFRGVDSSLLDSELESEDELLLLDEELDCFEESLPDLESESESESELLLELDDELSLLLLLLLPCFFLGTLFFGPSCFDLIKTF